MGMLTYVILLLFFFFHFLLISYLSPLPDRLDYAYFDNATPTSPGSTVTLTSYKLDDYTRSLGATLQQIVDAAGSLAVLIFNDSPIAAPLSNSTGHTTEDAPSSSTSGHTNGLLVADSNGGFWISHSLPGFPYLNVRTPFRLRA
jgi:hypothetical protein